MKYKLYFGCNSEYCKTNHGSKEIEADSQDQAIEIAERILKLKQGVVVKPWKMKNKSDETIWEKPIEKF